MIGNYIYSYKHFVNELVDTSMQAGFFKRKAVRKGPDTDIRASIIPYELIELQPVIVSGKEAYDLIALKNYCNLIQQKALLITKIRSQADVYVTRNASLLRHLAYNLAGLVLSIVFMLMHQRFSVNQEPAIDLFGILFKCISMYLCVSIVYQSVSAFVNTIISKHELLFWKKTTVGLLDEKEYTRYILSPLSGLKKSLYVIYPSVVGIYGILSYYSYKFPHLLQP